MRTHCFIRGINMIKIRYGVFETNSSSVHTLSIAQNEEIDKLRNGELLVNLSWRRDNYLISYEEALQELIKDLKEYGDNNELIIANNGNREEIYHLMYEYDIAEPFDRYLEDEYLEPYEEEFTTLKGDKILVFGRYGHD